MGDGWTAQFPLIGPAGELIDLRRVFLSHGIAELPPMRLDQKAWTFEITVPLSGIGARTLTISQARPGHGLISVAGPAPTPQVSAAIIAQVRHVLSLDLDLTPFYAVAAEDPDLAWVLTGAGRMARGPTVFEDVVKTICTTNTSWVGTTRRRRDVRRRAHHADARALRPADPRFLEPLDVCQATWPEAPGQ